MGKFNILVGENSDMLEVSFKIQLYGNGGLGPRSNKKENQCTAVRINTIYLPDKNAPNIKFSAEKQYGMPH